MAETDAIECNIDAPLLAGAAQARESIFSESQLFSQALQVAMQPLPWAALNRRGIEVVVRRDDLIDSHLSGNKYYKLFFNLQQARASGERRLLSFGGAYSNHLYALAAAGKRYDFTTVGVIRGERPARLSPTLVDAEAWGMQLHFVSRQDYRHKHTAEFLARLRQQLGSFYWVPEGGANLAGVQGCQTLGRAIGTGQWGDFDAVCLACGTGTTLAGVLAGLGQDSALNVGSRARIDRVYGMSVLKDRASHVDSFEAPVAETAMQAEVETWLQQLQLKQPMGLSSVPPWRLLTAYHGGGYAKLSPALRQFIGAFEAETGLLLDPVYTAKLFYGVAQLAENNEWSAGTRLLLIHSGGLQGRRGYDC